MHGRNLLGMLVLLVLAATLGACGTGDTPSAEVVHRDSAEVQIIESRALQRLALCPSGHPPLATREKSWRSERLRRV